MFYQPSWSSAKLDELNEITQPICYGVLKPGPEIFDGVPMLRVKDISSNKLDLSDVLKISNTLDAEYSRSKILGTEILISVQGTVGRVVLADSRVQNFNISRTIAKITLNKNMCRRFVRYYMLSPYGSNSMGEQSGGTTRASLNIGDLRDLVIPLPPLAEQKVIADKLDTLLAQVESTKARLERIPDILKRFRQSVLAAAVSGKLTEEWREENEFPNSVLHDIRSEKVLWARENPDHNEVKRVLKRVKDGLNAINNKVEVLPETWSWSQLEDCVLMIVDCHNKTATYTEEGNPLIRTSNIRDGKFNWENLRYVSDETYEYWSRRCPPEPGDIIFTREAPMGEAAIIPPKHKLCLGQRTMLIRPVEKYVSAKFILISLMDPNFRKRSEELAVGTGVKHYRVGDVSNLEIAIPPAEEQAEIVRQVDELFAFADSIEQKAAAALERVNNLTQSILAKAFRGELTADWRAANPELISGENSAAALLEKIKVEREVMKKQPKPKRSTIKKKTGSHMSKQIIKVVDALKEAGEPLSGHQLLAAAGYPSDSGTEQLEQFFLDIRKALISEKSIVKLQRGDDGQDWFALAQKSAKE
ncbi:restriction endonuclease subunit S [Shewanella mangrovisoli]|uniref:Restriction endonuclease subunit S n=1 Tax=Shewanella mangrovisoli TaxID=2864211 RepID=A0ABV4VN67_9GAMM